MTTANPYRNLDALTFDQLAVALDKAVKRAKSSIESRSARIWWNRVTRTAEEIGRRGAEFTRLYDGTLAVGYAHSFEPIG